MSEEWRDVVGYEGLYQVSNMGRIKSLKRISPQNHILPERIRKTQLDKNGYVVINLCKNGHVKLEKVHRLVCSAFHSNPDNKREVNHIDGNKTNNCVDNLEWVTSSENIRHAFQNNLKHGVSISLFGESNPHCKLTDLQVEEIRRLHLDGCKATALSEKFHISKSQIYRIIRREQRDKKGGNIYGN